MWHWHKVRAFKPLHPQDSLDDADVEKGLRMMLYDGMYANVMVALTSGAFLVGFALMLGASNTVIGLLSAIPPLSQVLQVPATVLVEKIRLRKFLVVVTAFLSRVSWFGIALLPWFVPEKYRMAVFFLCLFAFYGVGAFAGCAYNSWIRDVIPEKIMGRFFAKRMAWAIGLGAVVSMAAGAGIDHFKELGPFLERYSAAFSGKGAEAAGYSLLFIIATCVGVFAILFLVRMPEPRMHAPLETDLWRVLAQPFRDHNFRQLLVFLGSWNFAVNFAAPFFTVYMLKRLDLSMTWVLGLAVLSQLVNVLFLRLWGRLADKFSNKSVLAVAGPMFIFSFLMWPFTTMPDRYVMTIPILIAIHALGGISTAGMMLSGTSVALKLAPYGQATAYLAMNALVSGIAATIAPIIAGLAADGFENQELTLTLHWASTGNSPMSLDLHPMILTDLDFIFVIAFIMGLHAMHRLLAVREEGEVTEEIVIQEFYSEIRRSMRSVSHVFGLRVLNNFPYTIKGIVTGNPSWRRRDVAER